MRALVLVRNAVTHDARVLREVQTLGELGLATLVAGVVSADEPARRAHAAGAPVIRLAPRGLLNRIAALRPTSRPTSTRATPAAGSVAPAAPPRTGRLARLNRLTTTLDYYRQGIGLVRATKPALVHANDYNTMWIGLAAKVLHRTKLVYDTHELWADRNNRPEWRPWLLACEALFVRAADGVVTTSPGYADALARRYRIPEPDLVRNIPPGEPAPDAPPAEPDVAVYVGGLMPGRGLEEAIAAVALLPDVRLRLIGPGHATYVAGLSAAARRHGVADRLEIRAPVAPTEVVAAITGAGAGLCLIQPICRSYELTLPNKLFEYARAGLPVVATDLPVIADVVGGHGLGPIVAPRDPEATARGIAAALDPADRRRYAAAAVAFAHQATWEREQAVLRAVYADLTSASVRSASASR